MSQTSSALKAVGAHATVLLLMMEMRDCVNLS